MKKITILAAGAAVIFLSSAQGDGTASPAPDLELAKFRISNTATATISNWDFTVTDAGALVIQKEGQTTTYSFGGDGSFSFTRPGSFGSTFTVLSVDTNGNMRTGGTINATSDVARKENFGTIEPEEILHKLSAIPLKTWSYKGESITHVGPMAQDFHKAFGLGESDRTISMADADGVALASIQALHKKSIEKDRELSDLKMALSELETANSDLKRVNSKLEERLDRLEAQLDK